MDGIPLAIELAAAHVNVLSLSSVAEKLDDRFQILIGGRRTALPRQQTMRATIDWSYKMLSAQEQRVLEYLSVFVGGCSIASAIAVCTSDEIPENDVLELLASLIDKSLVMVDFEGREPRYWMLESFRQYARDQLAVRGEQQVAARRHALACLGLAEWFNRAFECEPVEIVRERGKHEGANWRAALHWSLTERGDVILGQRLAGQLGPYFSFVLSTARNTFFFGHLEGRRWIALALELVEARTPSSAFAALKHAEARIAGSLSEYERELELSHVALKHYRFLGDSLGIVRAQVTLAHALLYLGRRPEAGAVLESALPFGRELGSQCRFSVACLLRLFALATDDDVERARTYVEEALRIHRELGHESSIAYALLDSSECELAAGNVERALAHATEALASAPPANAFAECATAYRLSLCLAASRRYDEARDRARAALIPAREYRLDVYAAWILDQIGDDRGASNRAGAAWTRRCRSGCARFRLRRNSTRGGGLVPAGFRATTSRSGPRRAPHGARQQSRCQARDRRRGDERRTSRSGNHRTAIAADRRGGGAGMSRERAIAEALRRIVTPRRSAVR